MHQTETSFHKLEFGKVKLSICSNLFAFHFFFYLSDKIVFIASFKYCSLFTVFATHILVLQDLLITGSIKKTLLKPYLLSSLPFVIWDTRECYGYDPFKEGVGWVVVIAGWDRPHSLSTKKRHNSRGLFIYTNLYLRHILLKIHKLLYNTSPTINHFRYITWNAALILVRCKSPFSWKTLV